MPGCLGRRCSDLSLRLPHSRPHVLDNRTGRFLIALFALAVLMRLPGHPSELAWSHWLRWPVELPLLGLAMLLTPLRWRRIVVAVLLCALGGVVLLRLADLGARFAFGRGFSPLADMHLFVQGWDLASQSVGAFSAAAVAATASTLLVLVLIWAYRGLTRFAPGANGVRLLVVTAVLGLAMTVAQPRLGMDLRVSTDLFSDAVQRVSRARMAIADQIAFRDELAADPVAFDEPPRFGQLAGRDVIVLFVESYGRSFVDAPLFAERARAAHQRFEAGLEDAGLAVRSAWVSSPIRGGRSWLAQASLQSGLSLSNQARFDSLLASDRRPLANLFEAAGWTSAAVLPIVDGPWVEGAWYDVDRFFDGDALGYRGQDFGYVPMPDQFTLHAFERHVRSTADRPLFATIGLLGSHAPWTPLAKPVAWNELADGEVFDGSRRSGGPLDWARPGPVRDAYARSVSDTLERIGEYLALYARDAVFIVIGDHQPADIIAGWGANDHVPMHVIAREPSLLDRLPDDVFFRGMTPASSAPALPMGDIRTLLASRFESG